MLNAAVMPPAGHTAGFVSMYTFVPSDLPARIAAIRWFSKCGKPLTLDLTMEVESARSWSAAIQACQSNAWENVELEALNQLTVWLHQNHRERYQVWNDIVDRHTTEVIAPLINEKIIPVQLMHGQDVVLVHAASWDVLGALMRIQYWTLTIQHISSSNCYGCTRLAIFHAAGSEIGRAES